ncbi:hypothetical protein X474_22250 [Dethiosulfatarculus sandiegensis]|uniref:Uncharacterized protein n=1 Tax=Dethiosulfatarculus sandiegensis TaxID=1429043 RepID=A0A0D2JQL6_9BACT|nr:hypothetical protein X474_22250 [Dethiosulfatarculus sandiegensis]
MNLNFLDDIFFQRGDFYLIAKVLVQLIGLPTWSLENRSDAGYLSCQSDNTLIILWG